MRVIFMGTPDFAVVSLNKLISAGINIVGIVTAPDKPAGRGLRLQESPVKKVARIHNFMLFQPAKLRDPDFINALSDLGPDLILVVAFRILPEVIFTMPPLGTINLHGSILPKYRGAAPINWAIINGEKETGVTTFFIRKEVDTGSIIDTERISITPDMTAGELHDIMAVKGADLLLKTVKNVEQGNVIPVKQNDALSTKAPKITPQDCLIDFHKSVEDVHNLIRGLSPRPAAFTLLNGKRIKLYTTQIWDLLNSEEKPGTVVPSLDLKKILVQCAPGILAIREIQFEGKKRMSVDKFIRGNQIIPGTILGV